MKIFFAIDKTTRANKVKKLLFKKYKNFTPYNSNVIVVVGGDGFMLESLKKYRKFNKPFYGINSGTFGFLMNKFKRDNIIKSFRLGIIHPLGIVIRLIIGKGWGQGPQHSQSLHSWFAHLPGIKVAMPSTAFDAKGIMLESIFGQSPTIIIENRSLFSLTDQVQTIPYRVRYGKAVIRKKGKDITLVAIGPLVVDALKAASKLELEGISAEVIDPRTLTPLDRKTINKSVLKTRRLAVIDPGWHSFGAASEIIASISEKQSKNMKVNPIRLTLPDSHTPMSVPLEKKYYLNENKIFLKIKNLFQ